MKSNVSDYKDVMTCIYHDACIRCTADVSDLRDLKTIWSRTEDEGVSFLTLTLPKFCRDFEKSLDQGFISASDFSEFSKSGAIPAFLQGMLGLVFSRETGRIIDENCFLSSGSVVPIIVGSVRQICLAFKKMEIPCTPERDAQAVDNFICTENSFNEFSLSETSIKQFSLVSDCLWSDMLRDLRVDMLLPRHGPGATAERSSGNRKYVWKYWFERLQPYFPWDSNAYSMGCAVAWDAGLKTPEAEKITLVPEDEEFPVRVTLVPKTLKGPRVIAIEPSCMQYVQQGIRDALYSVIESNWISAGHVNFSDQSINQSLAMASSVDGRLATIDLSDASDRVPRDLALEMFHANPDLRDSIDACRSRTAVLPDGRIIPLKKFASMGSALCFPVEAMYFYTICVLALLRVHNLPVSRENCFSVSRDVYVYGDDILVPATNAVAVLDCLHEYHCKANSSKSFWTGKFRESCGTDAYAGVQVTPVYINTERPKNRRQASQCISWVATANQFYKAGYWRTSSYLFKQVEKILGVLPYVSEESEGLGRVSYLGYVSVERWNAVLHRFEQKCWTPAPVYQDDELDGYSALTKSLLRSEREDNTKLSDILADAGVPSDPLHLERSARHGAVALKRRWIPATLGRTVA